MVTTMLVPLDGSDLAEQAVPYATRLTKGANARVVLAHARNPLVIADGPGYDLDAVAERARANGVAAETRVLDVYRGEVAEVILEAARERRADLILMSTHGRGGLGRWLYGSVADRVLRLAEMPVLLVPAACRRAWAEDRPLRILVPLDGSPLAEEALDRSAELAEALGAEFFLLQIVQIPSYAMYGEAYVYQPFDEEAELAGAREYLEGVAERLRGDGRTVKTRAILGAPAFDVAKIARDEGADLIAMATHGYGGLARLVMGSVATGTLQRADVPILLSRPAAVARPAEEAAPAAEPEAAAMPAVGGPTIGMTLTPAELELLERGLADLLYSSPQDRKLAAPTRELLAKLKAATPLEEAGIR
jgi:nucleotide-binding universal stress UspA family protein